MINTLPTEILLNIFSYFRIPEIHVLELVSKRWRASVLDNEQPIYHEAAILHNFVCPNTLLSKVTEQSASEGPWLSNLTGWKDLCQRWYKLEKNWEGRGDVPVERLHMSTGKDVHRFKLDEKRRFIITTHRSGGLRVVCMDTDIVLFELTKGYVRRFAHCEYDNGFLVFDRLHPHALEIWRVESDEWNPSLGFGPQSPQSHRCRPDAAQLTAVQRFGRICNEGGVIQRFAEESTPSSSFAFSPPSSAVRSPTPPRRGCFAPWALFAPPSNPRAYRFVYPSLLIGSEIGQELYLFDVPSASHVQTIPLPRNAGALDNQNPQQNQAGGPHDPIRILYVELSQSYVFVCTWYGVLIIAREPQDGTNSTATSNPGDASSAGSRVVIDFPRADPSLRIPQLIHHYAFRLGRNTFERPSSNLLMNRYALTAPSQQTGWESTALVPAFVDPQEYYAVHVSPDGKDLATITWHGMLFLVKDFERVIRGEKTFSEISLRVDMKAPAINLAFDHGRVLVQTQNGVYIFTWDASHHSVISTDGYTGISHLNPDLFPNLTIHRLEHFNNPLPLQTVSCLRLTRTGVWLDWSPYALDEARKATEREARRINSAGTGAGSDGGPASEAEMNQIEIPEDLQIRYAWRVVCCVDFSPKPQGLNESVNLQ